VSFATLSGRNLFRNNPLVAQHVSYQILNHALHGCVVRHGIQLEIAMRFVIEPNMNHPAFSGSGILFSHAGWFLRRMSFATNITI
jgi:hypothetical protein